MSTTHTRGPWSNLDGNDQTLGIFAGVDRDLVATCHDLATCAHTEVAFANARLIAAAPDMLRILQTLAHALLQDGRTADGITKEEAARLCKTVIAKAVQ